MSVDLRQMGQLSLFEDAAWRTTVQIEPNHRLVTLCKSIPWEELMGKAIPILYDDQGISANTGRPLDLRAHLGAYILQTTYGWTDRWEIAPCLRQQLCQPQRDPSASPQDTALSGNAKRFPTGPN